MIKKDRILSFKFAFEGIWTALKDEPNLKFHFVTAYLTIMLGLFLQIKAIEWVIVILTIGFVISLELTNTAIENIVDSFTSEVHPAAKKAKDISSGAVLVAAITSVIVGLFIFLPYLI